MAWLGGGGGVLHVEVDGGVDVEVADVVLAIAVAGPSLKKAMNLLAPGIGRKEGLRLTAETTLVVGEGRRDAGVL